MSGVSIAWTLLKANSALLAEVPVDRIMAGTLPINTELPAISIMQISGTSWNTVKFDEPMDFIIERVSVTVFAKTYDKQKSIMQLVRKALPSSRGTVNGYTVDSVMQDSEGPDIFDADLVAYIQGNDFIIRFNR